MAEIIRALDDAGIAVETLDLHEPTLDDVFVAKTGRRLEGDEPEPEGRAPEGTGRVNELRVLGALARRSLAQTFRRPQFLAPIVLFPSLFLAGGTWAARAAR